MKFSFKKYIFALGLTSMLLPSCNNDFMERYPLDEITDESFWKTEKENAEFTGFCLESACSRR